MKILWICGLPEDVRRVHPVTNVKSAAWSWILGHLPPTKDVELHILCPVFAMRDAEVHFNHNGVHWHCFRLKRFEPLFLRLRFYFSIRKFVKGLKPDVIHGWGGESGCGLLATYCSPYAVVSVQGLLRMLCANTSRWKISIPECGSVSSWFRRLLEGWTYRRAHLLLVESETAADSLRELYGLEGEVVLHPLRQEFLNHEIHEKHEKECVFLFVGQMTERKGAMDALTAFSELNDKFARLLMVGSGDLDAKIDAFILKKGLGNRVRRIKTCSADELRLLMSEASAILVPSYGDTGPTVLKEALSQGLYSICYDNTGAKELVKRYVWGRLVTTGDINALKVAMVEVPSGKNMVVAEKVKRVLCHEKAWESLSYLYRDILSPVDFVVQRGSSPAIRQRVTHLRRICARLRSDRHGKRVVISCCTGVRQNLRAIIGAKFKGQKVIREINEWPLSVIWGENKIKQWFEVKVMPKFFNGFICISDVLVDFCREHGCKGSMILKMPMTVDMEEVESVIGESNGIGDYVCYAGSLSDEKDGVKTLISACSSFALKILNGLPRYEALQIMSKARCLVLARPDSLQARAGFPTKLGEYLTLGRPVVVTKVGEIPRFLEDNISAYLVEPGNIEELANKLREAFADTERSEVIGLAGKEVARAYFDWRNHEGELCEWMRLFI